ncbi:putative mediator of RNA polymerase II transcription subunit 26 [Clytia hemisphaerica]|uniref:WH1 domain-containing protein n=1 Tax=Clytia hemisphaerica TaxID=252671 RepID=A0A7M6DKE2_9CNID
MKSRAPGVPQPKESPTDTTQQQPSHEPFSLTTVLYRLNSTTKAWDSVEDGFVSINVEWITRGNGITRHLHLSYLKNQQKVYLSTTKDIKNVRKKDTFIRWSLDKTTYGARFRNDENAQKFADALGHSVKETVPLKIYYNLEKPLSVDISWQLSLNEALEKVYKSYNLSKEDVFLKYRENGKPKEKLDGNSNVGDLRFVDIEICVVVKEPLKRKTSVTFNINNSLWQGLLELANLSIDEISSPSVAYLIECFVDDHGGTSYLREVNNSKMSPQLADELNTLAGQVHAMNLSKNSEPKLVTTLERKKRQAPKPPSAKPPEKQTSTKRKAPTPPTNRAPPQFVPPPPPDDPPPKCSSTSPVGPLSPRTMDLVCENRPTAASDERQPPSLSPVTEDVVSILPPQPSPEMSKTNQEIQHLNGDSKEDEVIGDSSDELIDDDISAPTSPSLMERFESMPENSPEQNDDKEGDNIAVDTDEHLILPTVHPTSHHTEGDEEADEVTNEMVLDEVDHCRVYVDVDALNNEETVDEEELQCNDSNNDLDTGFIENTCEEEDEDEKNKEEESLEELVPQYPLTLPSIEKESHRQCQDDDVQTIEVVKDNEDNSNSMQRDEEKDQNMKIESATPVTSIPPDEKPPVERLSAHDDDVKVSNDTENEKRKISTEEEKTMRGNEELQKIDGNNNNKQPISDGEQHERKLPQEPSSNSIGRISPPIAISKLESPPGTIKKPPKAGLYALLKARSKQISTTSLTSNTNSGPNRNSSGTSTPSPGPNTPPTERSKITSNAITAATIETSRPDSSASLHSVNPSLHRTNSSGSNGPITNPIPRSTDSSNNNSTTSSPDVMRKISSGHPGIQRTNSSGYINAFKNAFERSNSNASDSSNSSPSNPRKLSGVTQSSAAILKNTISTSKINDSKPVTYRQNSFEKRKMNGIVSSAPPPVSLKPSPKVAKKPPPPLVKPKPKRPLANVSKPSPQTTFTRSVTEEAGSRETINTKSIGSLSFGFAQDKKKDTDNTVSDQTVKPSQLFSVSNTGKSQP